LTYNGSIDIWNFGQKKDKKLCSIDFEDKGKSLTTFEWIVKKDEDRKCELVAGDYSGNIYYIRVNI